MDREAIASAERAIRAFWRIEMQPTEIETFGLIVASLPRRQTPASPNLMLAAAGRELLAVREHVYLVLKWERESELRIESPQEAAVLDRLPLDIGGLVKEIEALLGAFPQLDFGGSKRYVRETLLIEIEPDRQGAVRHAAQLAHSASDAPEPREPIARMMLRAIAEDLRAIERFLAAIEASDSLAPLIEGISRGCAQLADSIEVVLPSAPDGESKP